jgi:hypothetical protein
MLIIQGIKILGMSCGYIKVWSKVHFSFFEYVILWFCRWVGSWNSGILGIVILQALVAQFVEKLLIFMENNEIQAFWEF